MVRNSRRGIRGLEFMVVSRFSLSPVLLVTLLVAPLVTLLARLFGFLLASANFIAN